MCGIVGYVGGQNATEILIGGLRRLEYRGYDSAGIAVRESKGIKTVRAEGKLAALEKKLRGKRPQGGLGIGHTRWATHGRPSETNAHPHQSGPVTLVHNGIIENYVQLRGELGRRGFKIVSETDTELVSHLIHRFLKQGLSMEKAFPKALARIEGSYALVVLHEADPDRLFIARNGSPLVAGLGENENFVASDIPALLTHTRRVLFLEDGDWGVVTRDEIRLFNHKAAAVRRPVKEVTWNQAMAEKGGFKHFMAKEIFEQPRAVVDTLAGRLAEEQRRIFLNGVEGLLCKNGHVPFDRIQILGCGTSYHAGLAGRYFLEELSQIPAEIDLASEFRYRKPLLNKRTLVIAVSQSGETADTLAAVREAREKGARVVSICNVIDSSIARASHTAFYTHAGPEIGVASTKAFTTQVLLLLLLALRLGRIYGALKAPYVSEAIDALVKLPKQMEKILRQDESIARLARRYADRPNFLYFGRGVHFPIALEGALKLKEISYIHAEGYAAGEMKHGPIALIEKGMPVVVLAPRDTTYEKIVSNIEEVRARGAEVIALTTQGNRELDEKCEAVLEIPKAPWYVTPLLTVLPLQLLAYHIADHKGTDVDQPRNLAKSVTVE